MNLIDHMKIFRLKFWPRKHVESQNINQACLQKQVIREKVKQFKKN